MNTHNFVCKKINIIYQLCHYDINSSGAAKYFYHEIITGYNYPKNRW